MAPTKLNLGLRLCGAPNTRKTILRDGKKKAIRQLLKQCNDVAHADYRENAWDAEKILQETKEVLKQLKMSAPIWKIF